MLFVQRYDRMCGLVFSDATWFEYLGTVSLRKHPLYPDDPDQIVLTNGYSFDLLGSKNFKLVCPD